MSKTTLDASYKNASADIWRWFVKWMEKGPENFKTAEWEEESHEIESIWRKYTDTPAKHYAERYAQICHAELTRCFDEAEREQYKQLTMPCGKEWAEK